jgi:hypothetical protein
VRPGVSSKRRLGGEFATYKRLSCRLQSRCGADGHHRRTPLLGKVCIDEQASDSSNSGGGAAKPALLATATVLFSSPTPAYIGETRLLGDLAVLAAIRRAKLGLTLNASSRSSSSQSMIRTTKFRLMPTKQILGGLVALAASIACMSIYALTYDNHAVGAVRPGGDRPCTLFQLVGVAQADPVAPNSPWFALESTAPGYKEMVATLLAAKAAGRNIQVLTAGTVSATCGHPTVAVILWL